MTTIEHILLILLLASLYFNWKLIQRIQSALRAKKKALRDSKRLMMRAEEAQSQTIVDKRRFIEALGEPFILIGPSGHISMANSHALALFREKLEGRHINTLSVNNELLPFIREAFVNHGATTKEFTLSGESSPQHLNSSITAWQLDSAIVDSPILEKRIIIRNVTRNYQTNQMRRDFVANASHELRTPLTIIMGYIENLMEDGFLKEQPELSAKFLGTMFQNSQRLMHLIEDMLMISKLESGQKALLKEEWFPLKEIIEDTFARLDSIRERKQATLQCSIPQDWHIYGDSFYWAQILFNLTENALKQNSGPNLKISIEAELSPEYCHLYVNDNGVGIPTEAIPYLFNRFYRVEKNLSPEIKGTGLGLSIVKHAIEAHDCYISATSTPHEKTTFHISIPLSRFKEKN